MQLFNYLTEVHKPAPVYRDETTLRVLGLQPDNDIVEDEALI